MPKTNNMIIGGDNTLEKWREIDKQVSPEELLREMPYFQ